jgi:hypothetical protein
MLTNPRRSQPILTKYKSLHCFRNKITPTRIYDATSNVNYADTKAIVVSGIAKTSCAISERTENFAEFTFHYIKIRAGKTGHPTRPATRLA